MERFRRSLRKRRLGGLLAGLAAYFLALQALAAGLSCGATLSPATDPLTILCEPSRLAADASEQPGDGKHPAADCPCALACLSVLDRALAPTFKAEAHRPLDAPAFVPRASAEAIARRSPLELGLAREPRGPPWRVG